MRRTSYTPPTGDPLVVLGRVGGAHGVRGWLKVRPYTEHPDALLARREWSLRLSNGHRVNLKIEDARAGGEHILVKFADICDRNQAQDLRGAEVVVQRGDLPRLSSGEYYWNDLQGLRVVTVDGIALGTVTSLMATGANDVLVVEGERQRLIPYVPGRYVTAVDLADGLITVDWDPEF